jgi:hypothetical protein
MTVNVTGMGKTREGNVRLTGSSVEDLRNQAPDVKELHYLLIEATSGSHPQPDVITLEFGNPEEPSRSRAFRGWFRRVREWDVRIRAESLDAQKAESVLAAAVSVLRGERITMLHVGAISLAPAIAEILGLALFVTGMILNGRHSGSGALYALGLVLIFYWRLATVAYPGGAGAAVYLQDRPAWLGIPNWSPSPRAQALWTVIGGLAGLAALIVAILAWLAPQA